MSILARTAVACAAAGLVLVGAAVLNRPLANAPLVKHPFALKGAATLPVQSAGTRVGAAHLVIPSLHVDALVFTTSIVDHELVIPGDVHDVGEWGRQADAGTTIVAGHINWVGQGPGALGALADIAPGSTVYLANRAGVVSVWSVVSLRAVLKKDLPQALFAPGGARRLVLITCGGVFDAATHQYADNVLATAVPARIDESKIATRTSSSSSVRWAARPRPPPARCPRCPRRRRQALRPRPRAHRPRTRSVARRLPPLCRPRRSSTTGCPRTT